MLLLLAPALFLRTALIPVPEFRTGTAADYAAALRAGFTLYGGAAIGIIAQWGRHARQRRQIGGRHVFNACLVGAIGAVIVATIAAGGGNLWGLVVIFGAVFAAIIAVGAGLVWHALRADSSG